MIKMFTEYDVIYEEVKDAFSDFLKIYIQENYPDVDLEECFEHVVEQIQDYGIK